LLKESIGQSRDFNFDEPEVEVAPDLTVTNLTGKLTLTRTPQGLYAQGQFRALVHYECARCLTEFEQPLNSRLAELYIYPPENAIESALTISESAHLDLAPVLREDMLLSTPMHGLCRPDCKGLCPQCGQNWNEGPCDCSDERRDPRFQVLTQLLKESEEK